MAKFIEVHKKPVGTGGNAYLILQNLDDVSAVIPSPDDTAVIALRNSPYGTAHFEVFQSTSPVRGTTPNTCSCKAET